MKMLVLIALKNLSTTSDFPGFLFRRDTLIEWTKSDLEELEARICCFKADESKTFMNC